MNQTPTKDRQGIGQMPDQFRLLQASYEARDRKHRDIEASERIFALSRERLEAECDALGIAHSGVDDPSLRQALIAAYRKAEASSGQDPRP